MRHLRERLIDPRSPDRRPRRAAYALPTLFTAGNLFLGFYALMETFRGAMQTTTNLTEAAAQFSAAAIAIGVAVGLDGLDGRIARMTNTVSEFGREMDSLADVITFGVAPGILAFAWGIEFTGAPPDPFTAEALRSLGYFLAFLYVLCGAMRLARFNIQTVPVLKNPGRPGRKYFAGLAIPSGAAVIAAVVFAANATPLTWWGYSVAWLGLLGLLSFLMISTWRYPSFKDINLLRPQSPLMFPVMGGIIYLIWKVPQPVLLAMAFSYLLSGIVIRIGGLIRRRLHPKSTHQDPRSREHPIG